MHISVSYFVLPLFLPISQFASAQLPAPALAPRTLAEPTPAIPTHLPYDSNLLRPRAVPVFKPKLPRPGSEPYPVPSNNNPGQRPNDNNVPDEVPNAQPKPKSHGPERPDAPDGPDGGDGASSATSRTCYHIGQDCGSGDRNATRTTMPGTETVTWNTDWSATPNNMMLTAGAGRVSVGWWM